MEPGLELVDFLFFHMVDIVLIKGGLLSAEIALGGRIDMVYSTHHSCFLTY